MPVFSLFPGPDWLALVGFFAIWWAYATYAHRMGERQGSLLSTTNRYRREWLLQASARDPRVLDGIIIQSLSQSPSFMASTTIIILGGLFALLGGSDKASDLVKDVPYAVQTTRLVFDIKIFLLIGIFAFAFFRFSWSMRQYTFAALVVGSMPDPQDFACGKFDREAFAGKAARVVGSAAETFNHGLRAYYFAFAAIAWFVSPYAMLVGCLLVVLILYSREFRSDVLGILRD